MSEDAARARHVVRFMRETLTFLGLCTQAEHERLVAAKSVLIVGGGAVGVELAAEILVDLPGEP